MSQLAIEVAQHIEDHPNPFFLEGYTELLETFFPLLRQLSLVDDSSVLWVDPYIRLLQFKGKDAGDNRRTVIRKLERNKLPFDDLDHDDVVDCTCLSGAQTLKKGSKILNVVPYKKVNPGTKRKALFVSPETFRQLALAVQTDAGIRVRAFVDHEYVHAERRQTKGLHQEITKGKIDLSNAKRELHELKIGKDATKRKVEDLEVENEQLHTKSKMAKVDAEEDARWQFVALRGAFETYKNDLRAQAARAKTDAEDAHRQVVQAITNHLDQARETAIAVVTSYREENSLRIAGDRQIEELTEDLGRRGADIDERPHKREAVTIFSPSPEDLSTIVVITGQGEYTKLKTREYSLRYPELTRRKSFVSHPNSVSGFAKTLREFVRDDAIVRVGNTSSKTFEMLADRSVHDFVDRLDENTNPGIVREPMITSE